MGCSVQSLEKALKSSGSTSFESAGLLSELHSVPERLGLWLDLSS